MVNKKKTLKNQSSAEFYTKNLKNRASLNGGVTVDRSVAIDRIRNSSIGLGRDILKNKNDNNLLQFGEDFSNSFWDKQNTTISINTTANPITGLLDADRIIETNVNNSHRAISSAIPVKNGVPITSSVYVKKFTGATNERRYLWIQLISGSDGFSRSSIIVDLSTGIVTTTNIVNTADSPIPISSFIQDVGAYYRVSATTTVSSGTISLTVAISDSSNPSFTSGFGGVVYTGDGVSYITAWGAQLEQGSVATPYYGASYVYSPSTYGEGKTYSVYPKLNNLLLWSEDFSQSSWIKTACTITSNTITNPIGGTSGATLNTSLFATMAFHQVIPTKIHNGTRVSISTYFKYNNIPDIEIRLYDGIGGVIRVQANIQTGVLSNTLGNGSWTNATSNISNEGNGWYRISVSGIIGVTTTSADLFLYNLTNGSIYIWGSEVEINPSVTPYQKTTSIQLDSDLAFTRATSATVTNKDGSIGDSCYNLLSFSEDFINAFWAKFQSSVSINTNLNPFGVSKSYYITDNTTSNSHTIGQSGDVVNGTTYTTSFYAKKANDTWCQFVLGFNSFGSGASAVWANFNFDTGLFGNKGNGTWTIKQLANGYWRITVTANAIITGNQSTANIFGTNNQNSGLTPVYVGTSRIFCDIAAIQFEIGSTPKDYLKTTNRLAVPRLDYSLDLTKPSLLIEPQATNIVFPSAVGSTQTRTVTAQSYTMQFKGTGQVVLSGVGSGTLTGTGTSNKVKLTFTATAGSLVFTVTGSITDFQVESGTIATTIIPTTTATVTRNAETSYVDLWNNNLLNKDNFTLYIEGYLYDGSGTSRMLCLADTTTGGTNDIGIISGIKASYAIASTITSDTSNLSNNTAFKLAIQRNGTTIKFFRNGVQIWSTQTVVVVDYRYLVVNNGGCVFAINKIELYKETLTDAQCISKTT